MKILCTSISVTKSFILNLSLLLTGLLIADAALAQSSPGRSLWSETSTSTEKTALRTIQLPARYKSFTLDFDAIKAKLANAPLESVVGRNAFSSGVEIQIPTPDGSMSSFQVIESPIMEEPLASTYPFIKTYIAQQTGNPQVTARLDVTLLGFHAMIIDPKGWSFIEPIHLKTTTDYICYNRKDSKRGQDFICGVESSVIDEYERTASSNNSGEKSSGTQLRTYRLALACTGEYAAVFGGTKAAALSAMNTSMNRVNGVYEKEVAVRMIIVGNDSLIVYTNSSTDPYSNGNGSAMLGQNQTTCDNVIGSANYDIGHVFSTGGGGVASLGVPCVNGSKARGVTGQGQPYGDPFDIDYVAHEMGHQFAGNHTFNSNTGNCAGGNRSSANAYEPGSGITIMAYAGICGSDNLAPNSIPYFHARSFEEIVNYTTTGSGNNCPVITTTGNSVPVITIGPDYSIPKRTPFTLTASATDPDSDPLTYSWEQMDLGAAGAWHFQPSSGSMDVPIFRPFEPTTSPSRTFPRMQNVVNNDSTIGEVMPLYARTLDFRFTVRDNKTGGGGVTYNDVTKKVTVVNTSGPFAVTSPNTAVTWSSGTAQTVTWNVVGSDLAPINCANVSISLSNDGGFTYPTVIVASTPNDGSETITVPSVITSQARIKVEAVGNIFFDISNTNFTIQQGSAVLSTITTNTLANNNLCQGSAVSVTFNTDGPANGGNVFTAQLSNSSGSFASPVNIGTLNNINAGTINATIPISTPTGNGYLIRVVSSNPVVTGSDNGANISVFATPAAAGSITGPATVCQGQNGVAYSVPVINNATTYTWTLPTGATIASGANTNSIMVNFSASASSGSITVTGSNPGCSGITSAPFNVTVNTLPNAAGSISGSANVCQGEMGVSYSVPSVAGATGYAWTLPVGATIASGANTNSITVNFSSSATSGNIYVSGTNACGSGVSSSFAVAVASVATPPVISAGGSTTVCSPNSVTLSFTPTAGVNYQWRRNGVNINGETSSTYNATLSGNYDVVATGLAAQTFSTSIPATITDNNCTGASSPITVSGYGSLVGSSSIHIKINITHTWVGDVVLYLQAPTGEVLGLSNRTGNNNNSSNNFTNTVFADSGATKIPTTGAPYTGLYKPWSPLFTNCIAATDTAFATLGTSGLIDPNGTWTLRAMDVVTTDSGAIQNWTITFPLGLSSCSSTSNIIGVTIDNAPSISGFNPTSGAQGTSVTISGSNFTGTTEVQFNGLNASFVVNTPGVITATVPAGASSGPISVVKQGTGCAVNSITSFTVINTAVLSIKLLIEGFYEDNGRMQPVLSNAGVTSDTSITDTVTIRLHNSTSPFAMDTSVTKVISRDGNVTFSLPGNRIGNSYYIAVLHRSGIETWSKLPVTIGTNTSFDFTD